ncbi:hypothetical protein AGABI2DRAFT_207517 [Agaricus bisporus var. bisporus H97]|uniref:hypothetical protein n=1 Tax=Agaricus bisporus var. bisporus (strain H97 / ATCC MYA-4626 / FGSC 10389) TaxID=936046 RepID=UPI00029F6996|nr:hypothetical protein AGABI2DRAFT_207517 [Agaricus bisporus var. bisporus H97]EKV46048.1 hypothetical protein AGABI2DRAFT_207517 [Agaricus bisporus var. bisporus H97]
MDSSSTFIYLPHELLVHKILVLCDPLDVARVAVSCKRLYRIVYGDLDGDRSLWRALYLAQPLDDLRLCVNRIGIPKSHDGIDWEEELKRVIRARSIVVNPHLCKGEEELQHILSTLLDLVEFVPPAYDLYQTGTAMGGSDEEEIDESVELAKNLVWVPVISREFLDLVERGLPTGITRGQYHIPPKSYWQNQTIQLHSQLHTLYGLTRKDLTKQARRESRAYIYDMRRYREENEFGPLVEGGRYVNWVHLEKIHHVISMHVDSVFEGMIEYMIYPLSMPFTQTEEGEGEGLPEDADWAGIEGDWAVFFCFYDHRQLMAYNQSADIVNRLDTSIFEQEGMTEEFRKLEAKFHVTGLTNDVEHPGRPIISFEGVVNQPSTSTMHGRVRLTSDNHLKWTFVSDSSETGIGAVWSSVGVQVGGVGSSFGVLGSWTTVFHDDEDPVGKP